VDADVLRDAEAHLEGRDAERLAQALLEAARQEVLRGVFWQLIRKGRYPVLASLLARQGAALVALAEARPDYAVKEHNAATMAAVRSGAALNGGPFDHDVLIVPGYTPVRTPRPVRLRELPAALARVELAHREFLAGRAPLILVSGGAVHPPGTPWNEGLMMAEELVARKVPPDRILIDPYARHSTTNLRNAGRMMLDLKLERGLIVTGHESRVYTFSQAFYFGHPVLSTFHARCRRELGYEVGTLAAVDRYRVRFRPASRVCMPNYRDPLDV
jgi:hypothetical protein